MRYDPERYWHRSHAHDDLSSVGQIGYSPRWNYWLYRAWLTSGRRFLARHGVHARMVCDVGAGRGSWFPVWRALGAEAITALELSRRAADRLNGATVHVRDITAPDATVGLGTFDLVAAVYVLLHVPSEEGFTHACANLAALVASGGHLLVADPIGPPGSAADGHSTNRPASAYKFPGLELIATQAATVIAGDPLSRRLHARVAFGLLSRAGSRLPDVIGPMVARVDPWLVAHTAWRPSSTFALYRR